MPLSLQKWMHTDFIGENSQDLLTIAQDSDQYQSRD